MRHGACYAGPKTHLLAVVLVFLVVVLALVVGGLAGEKTHRFGDQALAEGHGDAELGLDLLVKLLGLRLCARACEWWVGWARGRGARAP
jgi:hypothetical protein